MIPWGVGLLFSCLALSGAGQSGAGRDPLPAPPKAEAILERYIEVTGGKSAYASLKSIVSKGVFEVVNTPSRGNYTAYEAPPNKTRTIFEFDGGDKDEQGTLGDMAWAVSSASGVSLREGEENAIALREATFCSILNWRKLYAKAECPGTEKVGERSCYKVVLTPASGGPLTQLFDVESGYLLKSYITIKSPQGEARAENLYDDYRVANVNILFPHRLAFRVGSQVVVVLLNSVRCNEDVPWYRFDPPPEIRSLRSRKKP